MNSPAGEDNQRARGRQRNKLKERRVSDSWGSRKPAADGRVARRHPDGGAGKVGKGASLLLIEPRQDWYMATNPLPGNQESGPGEKKSKHRVTKAGSEEGYIERLAALRTKARDLLREESERYMARAGGKSQSETKFWYKMIESGTHQDRVSALTLATQQSPVHNMRALETLVGLGARKGNRTQSLGALTAVIDLLTACGIIPHDRKLRDLGRNIDLAGARELWRVVYQAESGKERKAGQGRQLAVDLIPPMTPQCVMLWGFEDWLKSLVFEVARIVEMWSQDELDHSRVRALTAASEMLAHVPEQEENMLRILVNKLGDPSRKVASQASYLLLRLQERHPAMKSTIIRYIEAEALFKPGQNVHARYYGIVTLNQTVLTLKYRELANQLLEIYFGLFVALLKTPRPQTKDARPGPRDNKAALPDGKQGGEKPAVSESKSAIGPDLSEQFHDRMIAQVLTGVIRALPFADSDSDLRKFEVLLDHIYRVAHCSNFNTGIRALSLIERITRTKNLSPLRYFRVLYGALFDPALGRSSKQIMYFNLLYRSLDLALDQPQTRESVVSAFAKRMLQISTFHQDPSIVCAIIFLVSEMRKNHPILGVLLDQQERVQSRTDDPTEIEASASRDQETESSRTASENPCGDGRRESVDLGSSEVQYNGRQRDPHLCHAEKSRLYELIPLCAHYHPSIALFARSLYESLPAPPKPDPSLHSVIHFLDRFVYRGPRLSKAMSVQDQQTPGISLMQQYQRSGRIPFLGAGSSFLIKSRMASKVQQRPVNDPKFAEMDLEAIPEDEAFFHKYFRLKKRDPKSHKKKQAREDRENVGDELDEDEVWDALVGSNPAMAGPDSDDDDDDEDREEWDMGEDPSEIGEGNGLESGSEGDMWDEDSPGRSDGGEDDLSDGGQDEPDMDTFFREGGDPSSDSRSGRHALSGKSRKVRKSEKISGLRDAKSSGGQKKKRRIESVFAAAEDFGEVE